MDSTRWERMQAMFHRAAELPDAERQNFLKSECGCDAQLISDVASMLEEDHRAASVLELGLDEVANQVFGEADSSPFAFREFGPYRVIRVLGEGGMGVVYLAERKDLGSLVAIKVLRDASLSPARCERFAQEQRTLANLNHPSIARLYDADAFADGTPYIVMEYVEGVPLTEYCGQHRCAIEQRLKLFRAVCEAVQYAHGHAVIHRDLKPSNILVKNDGTIRLLDFGIAKQLDALDSIDQTITGLRLLTPAYAAPEQVRGDRVGIHTDVYSLGTILFELITGQLPFDFSNLTPAEAATIIVEHEPGRPSVVAKLKKVVPGTSTLGKIEWGDLDVLCLTAMHKDQLRRYPSAEALIRDIDHCLKGEPLEARPDSLLYNSVKFVRRHQRSVMLGVATLMLIIGLVVFFTLRLAKARDAALSEAARTQRIQQFMMDLFHGGDEAVGPSDSLRVVTLVHRGVQQAKSLNNDPKVQAELYQNLGSIYQKLGNFQDADSLLHSALEQRKLIYGQDSPEVAQSLISLALLRTDQAQLAEAERFARAGLEMSRRNLAPNHPAVAQATFALGKVLEGRGSYDQAIQLLEESVRLRTAEGKATADFAASLSELANANFYTGNYDISDILNRRVLTIQRQLYGDTHPLIADTLINLGAIQFQSGRYSESERFNRQALDLVKAWYGDNHPETADAMTILAQSLTYQNRFQEAAVLLQHSLTILEHVYGRVHPRVAFALNELGQVAIRQGRLDAAENDFSREVSIYRSVYHDKHYLISIALSNLAGVYATRKQYSRAEHLFREALQRYADTVHRDHLNVGIAHARLGDLLLAEHRYTEAETESRAGFEILVKQNNPMLKWLQMARTDLVREYEELHQTQNAERFRSGLTHPTAMNATVASKH